MVCLLNPHLSVLGEDRVVGGLKDVADSMLCALPQCLSGFHASLMSEVLGRHVLRGISEDRSLILQLTESAHSFMYSRLMVRFCTLIIVSLVHVAKAANIIHSVAASF